MKFTSINKIVIIIFAVTFISCEGVFVPDPIDPRLPKYTEEGNDVAGAFIDGKIWKSVVTSALFHTSNEPYIEVYTKVDNLNLKFTGSSPVYKFIEFRLTGLNIHKFEDLIHLKDKKIPLDGIKNSAICTDNMYSEYIESGGVGQLYIKHVAMSDSCDYADISGTFGFTYNNINVYYGRFDYRFSKYRNFSVSENAYNPYNTAEKILK